MDELDDYNNLNLKTTQLQQQQQSPSYLNKLDLQLCNPLETTNNNNNRSWAKNLLTLSTPSSSSSSVNHNFIFDSLDGFFFMLNNTGNIVFMSENFVNYTKYAHVSDFSIFTFEQ